MRVLYPRRRVHNKQSPPLVLMAKMAEDAPVNSGEEKRQTEGGVACRKLAR